MLNTGRSHLENIKPHVDRGFIVLGGASLDEPVKEGESMKINGSCMMAEADNVDDVWEWIKNDVYYTSGVWDADKVSAMIDGCQPIPPDKVSRSRSSRSRAQSAKPRRRTSQV